MEKDKALSIHVCVCVSVFVTFSSLLLLRQKETDMPLLSQHRQKPNNINSDINKELLLCNPIMLHLVMLQCWKFKTMSHLCAEDVLLSKEQLTNSFQNLFWVDRSSSLTERWWVSNFVDCVRISGTTSSPSKDEKAESPRKNKFNEIVVQDITKNI